MIETFFEKGIDLLLGSRFILTFVRPDIILLTAIMEE